MGGSASDPWELQKTWRAMTMKKSWAVRLAAAVAAKHEINIPEIQNNININNSNINFIYLQD